MDHGGIVELCRTWWFCQKYIRMHSCVNNPTDTQDEEKEWKFTAWWKGPQVRGWNVTQGKNRMQCNSDNEPWDPLFILKAKKKNEHNATTTVQEENWSCSN